MIAGKTKFSTIWCRPSDISLSIVLSILSILSISLSLSLCLALRLSVPLSLSFSDMPTALPTPLLPLCRFAGAPLSQPPSNALPSSPPHSALSLGVNAARSPTSLPPLPPPLPPVPSFVPSLPCPLHAPLRLTDAGPADLARRPEGKAAAGHDGRGPAKGHRGGGGEGPRLAAAGAGGRGAPPSPPSPAGAGSGGGGEDSVPRNVLVSSDALTSQATWTGRFTTAIRVSPREIERGGKGGGADAADAEARDWAADAPSRGCGEDSVAGGACSLCSQRIALEVGRGGVSMPS